MLNPKLIDTHQFERMQAGAAYYMHGVYHALFDSGTSLSVPYIQSELPDNVELDYIFLTHVHLDHAGGAGKLALNHQKASVVVHPRGAKHLVDPSRLVESVRASTGDIFHFYGEAVPIDKDRVYEAQDGERFNLGDGTVIEAVYSPGHAPHHLCFFEPARQILFSGDATGALLDGQLYCTTTPPSFDLGISLQTIDRLRAMHPKRIFYAHFGPGEDPDRLLKAYADLLKRWTDSINYRRREMTASDLIDDVLADPDLFPHGFDDKLRPELAMSVRGVLNYLKHVDP